MVAFDRRLAQAEKRSATLAEAMQEQLALLHEHIKTLVNLEVPAGRMETDWDKRAPRFPGCTSIRVWGTTERLMLLDYSALDVCISIC